MNYFGQQVLNFTGTALNETSTTLSHNYPIGSCTSIDVSNVELLFLVFAYHPEMDCGKCHLRLSAESAERAELTLHQHDEIAEKFAAVVNNENTPPLEVFVLKFRRFYLEENKGEVDVLVAALGSPVPKIRYHWNDIGRTISGSGGTLDSLIILGGPASEQPWIGILSCLCTATMIIRIMVSFLEVHIGNLIRDT